MIFYWKIMKYVVQTFSNSREENEDKYKLL